MEIDNLLKEHERWLRKRRGPQVVIQGKDLSGLRLERRNLAYIFFEDCDLSGAVIHQCDLSYARFVNVRMKDVHIQHSDMRHALFRMCDIQRTGWRYVFLGGASFEGTQMTGCAFDHVSMDRAKVIGTHMRRVSMTDCMLSETMWLDAEFEGEMKNVLMLRSTIEQSTFSGSQLPGLVASGSNVRNASFRGASLHAAQLMASHLANVDFSDAVLSSTDFSNTTLYDCVFQDASLYGINLRAAAIVNEDGKPFRGAALHKAILADATLRTNLEGAYLTNTVLDPQHHERMRQLAKGQRGLIVYRTKKSQYFGDTVYEPGKTYVAPVFSVDPNSECHPGIYAGTLEQVRELFPFAPKVKCYVRAGDYVVVGKGSAASAFVCSKTWVGSDSPPYILARKEAICTSLFQLTKMPSPCTWRMVMCDASWNCPRDFQDGPTRTPMLSFRGGDLHGEVPQRRGQCGAQTFPVCGKCSTASG